MKRIHNTRIRIQNTDIYYAEFYGSGGMAEKEEREKGKKLHQKRGKMPLNLNGVGSYRNAQITPLAPWTSNLKV